MYFKNYTRCHNIYLRCQNTDSIGLGFFLAVNLSDFFRKYPDEDWSKEKVTEFYEKLQKSFEDSGRIDELRELKLEILSCG